MTVIAVDDERHVLNLIEKIIKELLPTDKIVLFDRSLYALNFAKNNRVDVAFLDITMPEINGINLAQELKKINPKINVIFCTGYSEYSVRATNLHASGYILKPFGKADVKQALDNLLYPPQANPVFYAKTFGNFDFYADGNPIHFNRSKSKEMLAYLISLRGATATRKELMAILFGDRYDIATQDYLTKIYKELSDTLKKYGAGNIVVKNFNSYGVDPKLFSCDLYDYDKGDKKAVNSFKGEFMSQYDWAIM